MANVDTELTWNGDNVIKNVNAGTIAALIRAGQIVKTDARLKVPVDDGILRGSIVKELDRSKLTETISTNMDYAAYVEFGTGRFAEGGGGRSTPWVYKHPKFGFIRTVGQKPQPYMRPALKENIDKIEKIFISEENKALGK
jgi:HK97 gp10 family phage protein